MLLLAADVHAAANRPDGFKTLCKIDQNCTVAPNTKVAFGAAGKFAYKVLGGSFVCNAGTFGKDPNPAKSTKECSVSKTTNPDPSQPASVSLRAAGGDGKVDLTWSVTGNITAVQVMRDTDANPQGRQSLATLSGTARSYTDSSVTNGTPYWYWISYTKADKTTGESNAGSATPVASNTPSDPPVVDGDGELLSCDAANTVQGFAGIEGGTTGGLGGGSVTVKTGAQLVAALASKKNNPKPITIYVDGTITPANSGGASQFDVKDMQNVSIIGVGDKALLDGIGINIVRANNIIVRNLTVRYNRIGQKDGISIQGSSHNVWIDHNEVYNSLDVGKDYYDELVSGKDEIDNVTLSYNYLHDSWKTSLWGSSDSNEYDRRVTFLGNHWEKVNSRLPLFRFGQAHVVNNYYHNVLETGVNARMGARIRVEANHFDTVTNPIVSFYSDKVGYWDAVGNLFENVTWKADPASGVIAGPQVKSTVTYQPPYDYRLIPVAKVKAHVLKNAGVGKLNGCL